MGREKRTPDGTAATGRIAGAGIVADASRAEFSGSRTMFSAASFFDVVDSLPASAPPVGEPLLPLEPPAVVAFYGFRGGAGRTLALAHVATLWARQGLRVVAVDLDFEAPGLHAALGVKLPEDSEGAVSLLMKANRTSSAEPLEVTRHLVPVDLKTGAGKVLLLTAGVVSRPYLAQIEELGVGLWHAQATSPLHKLLEELKQAEEADVVLLDCRTGFSALSATVLFHAADLIVTFLPLSDQVWDGMAVLLEAAHAAKLKRGGRPALLLVPAMVPAGDTGREITAAFVARLRELYSAKVGRLESDLEAEEDPDQPRQPWLQQGIGYDPRIAAAGKVDPALANTGAWSIYGDLLNGLNGLLELRSRIEPPTHVDAQRILKELQIDRALAFGENPPFDELKAYFVPPQDLDAAVERATALVVGAKGSGKTWLWRYLVNGGLNDSPAQFINALAPAGASERTSLDLSPDGFKELEKVAKMRQRGTHRAFWLLYAVVRMSQALPDFSARLLKRLAPEQRSALSAVLRTRQAGTLGKALAQLLGRADIGTFAEDLVQEADNVLAGQVVCLTYDGLDTGFQTGGVGLWVERRNRFVTALLQLIAEWRNRLRRLSFKVFLREDIFLSIEMQNRSHLDAATHELRWHAPDLWRIALNVVTTSAAYQEIVQKSEPGIGKPWQLDEDRLKRLLFPFWGERVERGKAAYTANYIQKRTADAGGRLFPRTLVQLLNAAVEKERKADPRGQADRVIRYPALRDGVNVASQMRVDDLRHEYVELAPYLNALKGCDPSASKDELSRFLTRALSRTKTRPTLHRGRAGWRAVIRQLQDVGVLGRHPRSRDDPERLMVALLYREGLGVRRAGLV